MKKFLLSFFAIASLWLAMPCQAQNYDFSAVAPSGQTLYYSYDGGGVSVVRPNSSNNGYITGDLIIPDSVFYNDVWNPVVSIGFSAFRYCRDMTSVYIPNSVTSIGGRAFGSCSSLTSFNIPNSVTSIGNNEFEYCTSLTSVYIPVSVTVINSRAFNHCTSLTSISIPDFVTFIDEFAFFGCSSLTDITIPNFVTYIGEKAFASCPSINSMTVSPGNPVYDSRDSCNAIVETANNKLHSGCKSTIIPNSITSIGNYAFYECSSMTSISIPYSITSVGLEAFFGCVFDTLNMGHFEPPTFYLNANIINIPCGATINYQNSWGDRNYHEPDVDITLSLSAIASDGTAAIIPQNGHMVLCSDSSAVILATPNYGYHFTQWTNGSTDNPDTLYLSGDSAVTAFFAKNLYNVVGIVNDSERGTVFGSNFVEYLDTVILTATANYGYHFTQWNDGNTDNPREVVATGDLSFTAQFDYNQYNITLNVDEAIHGTVTGAGDYDYLSQRTITANAEYGYHFTQWHDGNTDNPRTITLTQDTSFTAIFAKNLYSVAGVSEEYSSPRGVVSGSDTVEYLDTVSLTATPDYGYHFTQWTDGNTENPRQVVATEDLSFTALFDYNQYSITLNVNTVIHGTVCGAGDYNYLSQRTITANAEYGYHFTQWNDGNTDNPRTITLTQDTSFTAFFEKNQYLLTVSSNDNSLGSVTGSGTYEYLDEVPVTATTTAPHHHFVAWSDGATDTMHTIIITEDLSLTAIFAIDTHHVSLMVNNDNYGHVDGDRYYPYGSTAMVSATPYDGYYFVHWSNGDTDNPNSFTVTEDTLLTAFFAPEITPSICMVTVQDDHNVLLWEKDQTVLEYNIYREGTVSGVYELMTTIPYSSQSTWTDISSHPSTRSYRYRISATDVNGHEADQSEIHKTMHLTINQGYGNQWNLVWTEYEGVDYTTYVIYRGRTLSEMQQIDVMPSGGNTSYTDVAPPTGSNKIYYQVGIIMSTPCNPTKNEDVVLSNIATNDLDGIEDVLLCNLQVYANNEQIVVNSEIEVKEVQISDISGKLLKSVFVNGNNSVINTTDFAAGVYIVRVNTTNGPVTRKVVKR